MFHIFKYKNFFPAETCLTLGQQTVLILYNIFYIRQMYVYPGVTSLMYAAWKGHTGIVKILLQNGADVNIQNING